jgi:uncharacterized protein
MSAAAAGLPSHDVRDNVELNRYELLVGERVIGIADYRRLDGALVLPHTEIEVGQRGRGWGEVLVGAALDDIRRQGLRIVPRCWFVAEFVEQHREYRDLLA